jgi:hypothetical protein
MLGGDLSERQVAGQELQEPQLRRGEPAAEQGVVGSAVERRLDVRQTIAKRADIRIAIDDLARRAIEGTPVVVR